MNKEKEEYKDYLELEVSKTNALIENKILSYGMGTAVLTEDTQQPIARFTVADLAKYQGINTNNIYTTLKKMDESSINRSFMIRDKDTGAFEIFNMIEKFTYDGNGKIEILYTKTAGEHFLRIGEPYRKNKYAILAGFQSNASFRIYELLSAHEYLFERYKTDTVSFEYELKELKLQLGLVRFLHNEEARLKAVLKRSPTAAELFEKYPEIEPYKQWGGFKRRVLDVAQKEIQAFSEIYDNVCPFEYEPVVSGRGGKVQAVRFIIHRAKKVDVSADVTPMEDETTIYVFPAEMIQQVYDIMADEHLLEKDIISLLKASGSDVSLIKKTYKKAKKQSYLNNLVGWMISCMKEGWDTVPSSDKLSPEQAKRAEEFIDAYEENRDSKQEELPSESQIQFATNISEFIGKPLPTVFTKTAYQEYIAKYSAQYKPGERFHTYEHSQEEIDWDVIFPNEVDEINIRKDATTKGTSIQIVNQMETEYSQEGFLDYVKSKCADNAVEELINELLSKELGYDVNDNDTKNLIKESFLIIGEEMLGEYLRIRTVAKAMRMSNYDIKLLLQALVELANANAADIPDMNEAYLSQLCELLGN